MPTYKTAKRKMDRAQANWREKAVTRRRALIKWEQNDTLDELHDSLAAEKNKAFEESYIATKRLNYSISLVLAIIEKDLHKSLLSQKVLLS